jgi:hypothetical protein
MSEAIAIFPITPSSPMAELCDEWAGRGKTNLWSVIPEIAEMQSEGGAAGAMHGALLSGRVRASIAVSGGVHTALDVVKATMAGADVTQLVSAIVKHGPRYLRTLLTDLQAWMAANEWTSLDEMRGNMSYQRVPNPTAYERATYRLFH